MHIQESSIHFHSIALAEFKMYIYSTLKKMLPHLPVKNLQSCDTTAIF